VLLRGLILLIQTCLVMVVTVLILDSDCALMVAAHCSAMTGLWKIVLRYPVAYPVVPNKLVLRASKEVPCMVNMVDN
jgi:hypothetical protein